MTYQEAVMSYDGRDDRSLAVDGVQRSVSVGHLTYLKTACAKYSIYIYILFITSEQL